MYDLATIVERNKAAARCGVPGPKGVGAAHVQPTKVNVIDVGTGQVIDTCESAFIACSKYRQQQKQGEVRIEDVE